MVVKSIDAQLDNAHGRSTESIVTVTLTKDTPIPSQYIIAADFLESTPRPSRQLLAERFYNHPLKAEAVPPLLIFGLHKMVNEVVLPVNQSSKPFHGTKTKSTGGKSTNWNLNMMPLSWS